MTAVADRTEFLKILELSRLIEPDRLKILLSDPDFPTEQGAAAEKLIATGDLTRFQAKSLLAGKYRGFILGPYKLLDQIGKGGMGNVFLAEHPGVQKKIAIKVLAKELSNDQVAIERFAREARAASALTHPNIVRVHHLGQTGDYRYLVMEYVHGATLEQIIDRKGPFSVLQAVRIAMQAAAGLHHAHEKGFVHRDIKPENLMLTKDGQVKILDMGLTKNINKVEDSLTAQLNTNAILGTIDYLSPEQAMQSEVDHRADIYSLGATLFTLITGHSPFEGVPARQKLMHHQSGPVPLLTNFHAEVSPELAAVVAKMMAKKPADRLASMAEVVEALKPWAELDSDGNGVLFPSGITSITITELRRSMTPTLRDQTTATLPANAKRSEVVVATPTPIEKPVPVKTTSSLTLIGGSPSKLKTTKSKLLIILGMLALTGLAIGAFLLSR